MEEKICLKKSYADYRKLLDQALGDICFDNLEKLAKEILSRMDGKSEIFLLGNGGSAANAHHVAGDYSKTFSFLGKKLKINCLSDNMCYMSAAANDLDFSQVYENLIGTRILKNDLIIYFSGSGNSMNLVKSAMRAQKLNIKTCSITGYNGGALNNISTIPINVPVKDMEVAEDVQLVLMHYIKQSLCNLLNKLGSKNNMPKYQKRIEEDLIA